MKDIKGCQTFLSLKAENFGVFLCPTATLNLRLRLCDVAVFREQMLNTPPKPNSSTNVQ